MALELLRKQRVLRLLVACALKPLRPKNLSEISGYSYAVGLARLRELLKLKLVVKTRDENGFQAYSTTELGREKLRRLGVSGHIEVVIIEKKRW